MPKWTHSNQDVGRPQSRAEQPNDDFISSCRAIRTYAETDLHSGEKIIRGSTPRVMTETFCSLSLTLSLFFFSLTLTPTYMAYALRGFMCKPYLGWNST